jgi:hypothetical protein
VHTNDMLTRRRLCVCADLETHFIFQESSRLIRRDQAGVRPTGMLSHVFHVDTYVSVGARWGTQFLNVPEPKECHFWAIFGIENRFVRSPSATIHESGPLIAYSDYVHQVLSTDICHPVSPPSINDLDEKCSNRDFSPGIDKTRLKSSVCKVPEVKYSADTIAVFRLHYVAALWRETVP